MRLHPAAAYHGPAAPGPPVRPGFPYPPLPPERRSSGSRERGNCNGATTCTHRPLEAPQCSPVPCRSPASNASFAWIETIAS